MSGDSPFGVTKHRLMLPISDQALAESGFAAKALLAWMHSTPEERAQAAAEAKQRAADERAAATHVPLTLDALLAKMGWTREYAEHLVQPYCECWDGMDGWEYCQHARDLGLTP